MTGPAYKITDHVCAACLGRILASEDGNRCRCSNCGLESEGKPRKLCCCGIKLKNGKDAGIRCVRNEARTPEFPGEIVAAEEAM